MTALPPTAVPTRTPLPTSTTTITPTATPVPSGPCDSPLLPLKTGNEWTYRVTTESGEALYILKALNRDDSGNIVVNVEFTNQKTGAVVLEPVVCYERSH